MSDFNIPRNALENAQVENFIRGLLVGWFTMFVFLYIIGLYFGIE